MREAREKAQARVPDAALTFHEQDGGTFEAPPGEVRARIVAENARGMRLDTSDAAVDVPDFTKPGPTISTPIVFRGRTARDIQVIKAAASPFTTKPWHRLRATASRPATGFSKT